MVSVLFRTLCLVWFACVLTPLAFASEVAQWSLHEVSLTASSTPANPFTDVSLTAEVTAPDGKTRTVHGFFDGDGRGGQEGNVWKLRFSPDQVGEWRWVTASNDAGLDGQRGSFTCVASDAPGPVTAKGRYFYRANGTPIFLLGNFLDVVEAPREQFSHTLLSEEIDDANREHMITRQCEHYGANKINIYLANRGDYGGISTTPWLGSENDNDKTRFDLARWRMYDRVLNQVAEAGLVAELWFFADDSQFGGLSQAERDGLIDYAMARLSAYPHTMFVLFLEWQEALTADAVVAHVRRGQSRNPWGRLWSVHGLDGDFSFPNEPAMDFMATQPGNDIGPGEVNAHTVSHRAFADKPLLVEELGILKTEPDKRLRGNIWGAFCGGAAGVGTGSDILRLAKFIESREIPFWEMAPDNSVTSSGFALVQPGKRYVVYVDGVTEVTVNLAPGTYAAEWFNPRQKREAAGTVDIGAVEGGVRTLQPPSQDDWVLYVHPTR